MHLVCTQRACRRTDLLPHRVNGVPRPFLQGPSRESGIILDDDKDNVRHVQGLKPDKWSLTVP